MDYLENSYIRSISNSSEFCISECVKKIKDNLNEKENECIKNCLSNYEKAMELVIDYELSETN